MTDPARDRFELERFVDAQSSTYPQALAELRAGRKTSHWMWFVFPQAFGLGQSAMSQRFGIRSLAEARAYLAHPVLGPRLRACCDALLASTGRSAEAILGPVDARKLQSSMTLFRLADPAHQVFGLVLDRFFHGRTDDRTEGCMS